MLQGFFPFISRHQNIFGLDAFKCCIIAVSLESLVSKKEHKGFFMPADEIILPPKWKSCSAPGAELILRALVLVVLHTEA